jgi:BMFP domain-containing protein YqiC
MRAAVVGGVAYHAGKRAQRSREEDTYQDARLDQLEAQQAQEAPPAAGAGMSDEVIKQLQQLAQLKDQGILTQEEFDQQKQKLLQGS